MASAFLDGIINYSLSDDMKKRIAQRSLANEVSKLDPEVLPAAISQIGTQMGQQAVKDTFPLLQQAMVSPSSTISGDGTSGTIQGTLSKPTVNLGTIPVVANAPKLDQAVQPVEPSPSALTSAVPDQGLASKIQTAPVDTNPRDPTSALGNFMQSFGYGAIGKPINAGTEQAGWQTYLGGRLGKMFGDVGVTGKPAAEAPTYYNSSQEKLKHSQAIETEQAKWNIKNTTAPRWGDKTPEEVRSELEKKDPSRLRYLEKVARGEIKLGGRSSKEIQRVFEDASYLYPDLDQSKIDTRFQVRKDFTSGKAAQNVKSLNTAVQHLKELNDLIPQLDNKGIRKYNTVKNFLSVESGKPQVRQFQMVKTALSGELAAIFKNSGATDQEISNISTAIDSSDSQEQLKGVVKEATKLMHGRMYALQDQWGNAFDREDDKMFNVVSPRSQKILDEIVFETAPTGGADVFNAIDAEIERRKQLKAK